MAQLIQKLGSLVKRDPANELAMDDLYAGLSIVSKTIMGESDTQVQKLYVETLDRSFF